MERTSVLRLNRQMIMRVDPTMKGHYNVYPGEILVDLGIFYVNPHNGALSNLLLHGSKIVHVFSDLVESEFDKLEEGT